MWFFFSQNNLTFSGKDTKMTRNVKFFLRYVINKHFYQILNYSPAHLAYEFSEGEMSRSISKPPFSHLQGQAD